jgi:hypothetical protein
MPPTDGDVYHLPPGVEARYATIALRAAGGTGQPVRWFVDGREQHISRWPLTVGVHQVAAWGGRGSSAQVTIRVE